MPTIALAVLLLLIPSQGESVAPVHLQIAQAEKTEKPAANVQEFEMTMSVYPAGKFSPDPLTVKKGIRARLLMKALHREHLNQISIRPFVTNVTLQPPEIGRAHV